MLVKCSICGETQELTKIHKDYQRIASNPNGIVVCFQCNCILQFQAKLTSKWEKKPL